MSWLTTFVSGIAGLFGGGLGMFAISIACVKWYRISNFEGASGYFVVALTILGGLGGFVLAAIAGRLAYSFVAPLWYHQVGYGLAAVGIALGAIFAFSYLGVDRVPDLGGEGITSLWEIKLPASGADESTPSIDPREWPDDQLQLELVSVVNSRSQDSRKAEFDRTAFREEEGQWIVVARVPLFTSKGVYCVNLKLGDRSDGFWPAMRPVPSPEYRQWSPWTRTNQGAQQQDDKLATMYRFKHDQ
jgi:hypothetical protein